MWWKTIITTFQHFFGTLNNNKTQKVLKVAKKVDWWESWKGITDRRTNKWTDISNSRVASLLKIEYKLVPFSFKSRVLPFWIWVNFVSSIIYSSMVDRCTWHFHLSGNLFNKALFDTKIIFIRNFVINMKYNMKYWYICSHT